MVLKGTVVNALAILLGGLIGVAFTQIPDDMGDTVMQGLGLAIIVLGISMSLKSNQYLVVIFSLVIGGIIGEWIGVEHFLNQIGKSLEHMIASDGQEKIAVAFVTTTLVYCIGSMAILGSLDSGLRGDHQLLYTKAMLDGFSSIIFATTLGIGVIFSAIPVFLYQGMIALSASTIRKWIEPNLLNRMINEITATGGILIIGIGINLIKIIEIHIASFLPSVFVAALLIPIADRIASLYKRTKEAN